MNGYAQLKTLDIGYFFYTGSYAEGLLTVLNPAEKTILHIPNVNARESTGDKHKEVDHIIDALGAWQETDAETGFHLVKTLASGIIYVLRSKSDLPVVSENRDLLHKIGVTGGRVERRIANAKLDPTFLMADVEIVTTYELYNINRVKLENLLLRVFERARLEIEIKDRFGHPVTPRECFLVPLFAIDEAVERIRDGSIKGVS